MQVTSVRAGRYYSGKVAKFVAEQLPDHSPVYTDTRAKFIWLKVATIIQEQAEVISLGMRTAAGKSDKTPKKKSILKEKRKTQPIYDPSRIGTLHFGLKACYFHHTGSGFFIKAENTKKGYMHSLKEGERLYDGIFLENNKVLELIINNETNYEIGLLLTPKQLPFAQQALASMPKTQDDRNGVVFEKLEHNEEKVEKKNGETGSRHRIGTYLLLSGGVFGVSVVFALKMGYVRVPTGVSTWMVDKQEWVMNKWEQVRVQVAPTTPVKV